MQKPLFLPSSVQKQHLNLGEEKEWAASQDNRKKNLKSSNGIWEIFIRTVNGDEKQQAPFPYS